MSVETPDISLVILCYRAGRRIHKFLDEVLKNMDSITPNWEVILVGNYVDGSDDETPEVVREIAKNNPKIKAITESKQGWFGWDARRGLQACNGKLVAFIDGDEQMIAEDITRAYHLLQEGDYDLVMPYRKIRRDSWMRRINSRIYNLIFNFFFPFYWVRDVHSKPKLFKREAFQKLRLSASDWFLDAEIMIQARRYGFKLKQFPTVFHAAAYRKSFVRVDAIFEFAGNLIKARFAEFFVSKTPPEPVNIITETVSR